MSWSRNSAPGPLAALSTWPTRTVAPDRCPGEPPPAHQPTTDGLEGMPSVPPAATPTGTTRALTPMAGIPSRTGTAVNAAAARSASGRRPPGGGTARAAGAAAAEAAGTTP